MHLTRHSLLEYLSNLSSSLRQFCPHGHLALKLSRCSACYQLILKLIITNTSGKTKIVSHLDETSLLHLKQVLDKILKISYDIHFEDLRAS